MARITEEVSPERRPIVPTPDPYTGHLKPFGTDIKPKIDFGNKYTTKSNGVPPPGYYNPNESLTKTKSPEVDF